MNLDFSFHKKSVEPKSDITRILQETIYYETIHHNIPGEKYIMLSRLLKPFAITIAGIVSVIFGSESELFFLAILFFIIVYAFLMIFAKRFALYIAVMQKTPR